jgi:glycosyltransferase involved in cell wall biosynthesis
MRILIAADLYWPTINGVAVFSRNLAQGLARRGHEVVVIAPSQTGKKYREVDQNYVIERTASLPFPFYQNFRVSLTPQREVKSIIKRYDPDVIHIQSVLGIGRAALSTGNKMGIPTVATNHAMPENLLDNLRLLAPFARPISSVIESYGTRFHNNTDYVTTPTQAAIDMFGDKTKSLKVPIEAVSNGIDLQAFSPGKPPEGIYKKFGIPAEVPVLLYLGRVDTEKHLSVLVAASAKVIKRTPAHLVIVGYGNESERLKQQAAALGIARHTTLTGKVDQGDIAPLLKTGTIFCMPSPAELQSIATLEAMASGLPVVAVNAGALHELCHDGENGYLFKYDDDTMMAAAILKLLKNDSLRAKMAQKSVAIAKTHDINHTLDRFEAIYTKLIDQKA